MPMRDHFCPTLIILRKKLQTRHTFNERHRSSELRATFIHVSSIGQMDRSILFIYANRFKSIETGF